MLGRAADRAELGAVFRHDAATVRRRGLESMSHAAIVCSEYVAARRDGCRCTIVTAPRTNNQTASVSGFDGKRGIE